ncbi:hypothetical protein [Aequorivita echinoideorum]|nr:hypothetical protein [Aequorivita echinoideorum]
MGSHNCDEFIVASPTARLRGKVESGSMGLCSLTSPEASGERGIWVYGIL